jgi:three-Cys-motif partner protein
MRWWDNEIENWKLIRKSSPPKCVDEAFVSRPFMTVKEPVSIYSTDDGLYTPEVGVWGIQKYNLVALYNQLFSTGMKKKWEYRVYIDLFAGAGKARIKENEKVVFGSPLLALSVPDPYDRYIFCEQQSKALSALKQRVNNLFPRANVEFVQGDCNEVIDLITSKIPKYSRDSKVLSFCFVDPFSLNIHFETIRKLSAYLMDFLILLMLMDPIRNENLYVNENSDRIGRFLGLSDWRERWKQAKTRNTSIRKFLATEFANQMITVGYREESLKSMVEIRSEDKNLPLYYLGFFSRDPLGYKFWKQVRRYATNQLPLGL